MDEHTIRLVVLEVKNLTGVCPAETGSLPELSCLDIVKGCEGLLINFIRVVSFHTD